MTFTTFVAFDMCNALACRSADAVVGGPRLRLFSNSAFCFSVGGSLLALLALLAYSLSGVASRLLRIARHRPATSPDAVRFGLLVAAKVAPHGLLYPATTSAGGGGPPGGWCCGWPCAFSGAPPGECSSGRPWASELGQPGSN